MRRRFCAPWTTQTAIAPAKMPTSTMPLKAHVNVVSRSLRCTVSTFLVVETMKASTSQQKVQATSVSEQHGVLYSTLTKTFVVKRCLCGVSNLSCFPDGENQYNESEKSKDHSFVFSVDVMSAQVLKRTSSQSVVKSTSMLAWAKNNRCIVSIPSVKGPVQLHKTPARHRRNRHLFLIQPVYHTSRLETTRLLEPSRLPKYQVKLDLASPTVAAGVQAHHRESSALIYTPTNPSNQRNAPFLSRRQL